MSRLLAACYFKEEFRIPLSLSLSDGYLWVYLGSTGPRGSLEMCPKADVLASADVPFTQDMADGAADAAVHGLTLYDELTSHKPDPGVLLCAEMPRCFLAKRTLDSGLDVASNAEDGLSTSQALLPLRILDLGEDGHLSDIRLHTRVPNERGSYATLSHRWGHAVPLVTKTASLKRHSRRLNFQDLPKTFQDAVSVTRLLGLRYLWIDALCIVQDNLQDWREQAEQMCSIYQFSSVTIAVHSAEDPRTGFLQWLTVSNWLTIAPNGTKPAFAVNIPPLSDDAIDKALAESSIVNRGWVTQELCLSQRVLHFVEDRAIWECHHQACATKHPTENHMERFRTRSIYPSEDWLPLVAAYTRCRITKEGDKLAAIAGIAKAWPKNETYFRHHNYYCGIFNDDMPSGLLWYAAQSKLVMRRQRAPSWSWASVDGAISFVRDEILSDALRPLIVVKSINCLCGRSVPGHFLCTSCHVDLHAAVGDGLEIERDKESKGSQSTPLIGPRYSVRLRCPTDRVVGWATLDDTTNAEHSELRFRYVRIAAKVKKGRTRGSFTMIVSRNLDTIGQYHRVGIGYIFNRDILEAFVPEAITLV